MGRWHVPAAHPPHPRRPRGRHGTDRWSSVPGAGAAGRHLRGGRTGRVGHHGLPPVPARRDLRPRRIDPGPVGADRRRRGRRLPDRPSLADGGGAVTHPPRGGQHPRTRAVAPVGLRDAGPPGLPTDGADHHQRRLPWDLAAGRLQAQHPQRQPGLTGPRVHQRRRPRCGRPRVRGQPPLAGTDGKETILESPSGVALPQSSVGQVATSPGTGLELTLDPSSSTSPNRPWPRPSSRPTP